MLIYLDAVPPYMDLDMNSCNKLLGRDDKKVSLAIPLDDTIKNSTIFYSFLYLKGNMVKCVEPMVIVYVSTSSFYSHFIQCPFLNQTCLNQTINVCQYICAHPTPTENVFILLYLEWIKLFNSWFEICEVYIGPTSQGSKSLFLNRFDNI